MNPRQRRGMLLLLVALIGGGAVFVSVTRYVAEVRDQVDDKISVYRLAEALERNTPMSEAEVETVTIPEKWVSAEVLRPGSEAELVGQIAAADLPAGAFLQRGMYRPAPPVLPGQREVTIMIDREQGVGGKIQRGSVVDILATFGGASDVPACLAVVASNVPVVDFGFATARTVENPEEDAFQDPEIVVPVNLALDAYRAKRLVLAESFANTIRLVGVTAAPSGDQEETLTKETYDCGPDLLSERPPPDTLTTSAAEETGTGG